MADNKQDRGEPDRSLINMNEDYEVQYWTGKFGVSREKLQQAVDAVGASSDKVAARLKG